MAIENKKYIENKNRKKYVLTFEDLQYIIPAFRSKSGALLLKILYSLAGIDKINDLYSHSCDKNGSEFVDSILKELGITYNIHHKEILNQRRFCYSLQSSLRSIRWLDSNTSIGLLSTRL